MLIGDYVLDLYNKASKEELTHKAKQLEELWNVTNESVAEWKYKLDEYNDKLHEVGVSIESAQKKLHEYRKSWGGTITEWFFEKEIKETEKLLSTLESRRQKLKDSAQYAKDRIAYYSEKADYYAEQKEEVAHDAMAKNKAVFLSYAKLALLIMLCGWLAFLAIRLFMYYILAPLVERAKPISIIPSANGDISFAGVADIKAERRTSVPIGAVSLELPFNNEQEVLTHQNYLQSSNRADNKKTKLFFSTKYFATSIFSGLTWMMSCRTQQEKSVVSLSPPTGIINEIGVVEILDGTSFICRARAIVGVVKKKDAQVEIKSKWRFGVHNWVTFQFRYLVFKGPCELIIKGSRGIKVEKGGKGRMINRSRILGFSANMEYSNTRCETFIAYLVGSDDLFNDLFNEPPMGVNGYFIYEEIPSNEKKNIFTKGIQGLLDVVLKLFGI